MSPFDVSMMQQAASAFTWTPCQIQSKTPTSDGMGGQTETWASVTTVCQVMSQSQTVQETTAEGRLQNVVRWMIALPPGTATTDRDRIVVGPITYEVTGVLAPKQSEVRRLVQCEVVG